MSLALDQEIPRKEAALAEITNQDFRHRLCLWLLIISLFALNVTVIIVLINNDGKLIRRSDPFWSGDRGGGLPHPGRDRDRSKQQRSYGRQDGIDYMPIAEEDRSVDVAGDDLSERKGQGQLQGQGRGEVESREEDDDDGDDDVRV